MRGRSSAARHRLQRCRAGGCADDESRQQPCDARDDWETCNTGDQDEDPNCYNDDDVLNVASMADHPSDPRGGDFTSANMMWDPFITQSERGDIDDEVLGSKDVGVAFYEGITAFPAFQNENFTIPQL